MGQMACGGKTHRFEQAIHLQEKSRLFFHIREKLQAENQQNEVFKKYNELERKLIDKRQLNWQMDCSKR